ncbi:MAG: hypothetical protein HC897_01215 [Thermoanaerobaculia bacterium]|nr:hypothetical protein [Thermoanaerobaculia bacterium]
MDLLEVLDLYGKSAQLSGLYWNLYVVVAGGILGFVFAQKRPFAKIQRLCLAGMFVVFAIGNHLAFLNKQTLHAAIGYEVVAIAKGESIKSEQLQRKLSDVCGGLPLDSCLHATKWWSTLPLLILVDLFVITVLVRDGISGVANTAMRPAAAVNYDGGADG